MPEPTLAEIVAPTDGAAPGDAARLMADRRAFHESEARYQAVAENMGDGLVITTLDDVILDVNPRLLEITGHDRASLVGRVACEVFNLPGTDTEMRARNAERAAGRGGSYQIQLRRKDGSCFWAEITGAPLRDAHGKIYGTIGVVRDATERLARERALRESEARLRTIFAAEPECVKIVSSDWELLDMNPAGLAMLEVDSVAGAKQRPLIEWVAPEHRAGFLAFHQQVLAGSSGTFQFRIIGATGTERWMDTHAVPMRDSTGRVTALLAITRDISQQQHAEQRRASLEAQLRQAQKVEAIGTLAGGIAHDFNNILGAILAYTDVARMDAAEQPPILASLNEVNRAALRAADLVRQILTFSRRQPPSRAVVGLPAVIAEVFKLIRPTLPATIQLETDLDGRVGSVLADTTQLHQVLVNLTTNASHAIGTRPGRIEIGLAAVLVDSEWASRAPDLQPGPYARLTVRDTGDGMDEKTLSRIFDPFFTTKPPGHGTGLGLGVVLGIVQEHDGAIRVHSQPGVGTTFEVFLPVVESLPAEVPAVDEPLPRGQGQRILFVDDEAPLCLVGAAMLRRLNYQPTTLTDPQAALVAFRADPAVWDLVITDLTMPGMTGITLAEKLLGLRPDLKILMATGYSGTWTSETVRHVGFQGLMMKPLTQQALAHAVQRTLHTNSRTPRPA